MGCGESKGGGWSEGDAAKLRAAEQTGSSLSFIGSSLIIVTFLSFPSLRKFAFKLVAFLSLSDALASFGDFIQPPKDSCGVCLLQSFIVSIFDLSSVLWTACIAHCLVRAIRYRDSDVQRYEMRYHAIAWGIPFFLFLLPLFSKSYGYEYGACWILSTAPVLRFVQFYIPLWIVIGYNVWNVSTLIFHLRGLVLSTQDDSQTNSDLQLFWRLALYPVILIVCWFFGTINRIYNSLYPDEPIFVLYFLHKFFGSMQGFFNFLVYGMSTAVRAKLYEALSWFLSLFGIKLQGASSDEMELTKYSINREEADG